MTALQLLPVPAGPDVLDVLPALEQALAGRSPVLPYAAADAPPAVPTHDDADLPEGLAVAIGTSGSTGRP
ncbi:MAG: AMP-dependent synthetase, partial [Dermatophilaceae bacterium]|nr:AMP-dependent synthetase [Dermatophilaceae bacterium]